MTLNESFDLNQLPDAGVHVALGITVEEATPERVVVSVPVTSKVHQPYGILHGGVSALLAESAASIGGAVTAPAGKVVVGTELNCSHLRSMTDGLLTAIATPIRIGRTIQVWGIELTDEQGRTICTARCSLAVIERP
jgi:uncharacterized protein (TIGR00369 family)